MRRLHLVKDSSESVKDKFVEFTTKVMKEWKVIREEHREVIPTPDALVFE